MAVIVAVVLNAIGRVIEVVVIVAVFVLVVVIAAV